MAKAIFKAAWQTRFSRVSATRLEQETRTESALHCLTLWFSARLRSKISNNLIDLCAGHVLRFNGVYIPREPEELGKSLNEAKIAEMLKLQEEPTVRMEIEELRRQVKNLEIILVASMSLASFQNW